MTATQKLAAAISAAALTGATALQAAVPVVSNVEIEQISFTRRVRITYDLADADAIVTLAIETNDVAIPDSAVTWLSGEVNKKVTMGEGKVIEWNAGADWPENVSDNTKARVTAWSLDNPPAVVVVDLSAGSTASTYPAAWYPSTDALLGGVANAVYKNTKLVLQKIRCGTFVMGGLTGDKDVILTDDFYIGVYQLTQGQWNKVMGNWPAHHTDATDRLYRPVEKISYNNIRESGDNTANTTYSWPDKGHDVNPASFMGKLRDRTGDLIRFDLPTEAQWEYACRARTMGLYNVNGAAVDDLGWHEGNSGGETHVVGEKLPNAWGLYDMHGNVYEWCLDWYDAALAGGKDPKGPVSSLEGKRVFRGGRWDSAANLCTSASRNSGDPTSVWGYYGFRVAAAAVVTP